MMDLLFQKKDYFVFIFPQDEVKTYCLWTNRTDEENSNLKHFVF